MIGLLALTVAGAAALLTQVGSNEDVRSNPQVITDPDLGTCDRHSGNEVSTCTLSRLLPARAAIIHVDRMAGLGRG